MKIGPKRVLIEDWLPIKELGIESRRERAVSTTLPPLSRLHVWWARRPLAASAGVVLGGLLPSWSEELAKTFPNAKQLSSERLYREWLLYLVGVWGDPIQARLAYDQAVALGVRIPNPYTYKMAYKNLPSSDDLALLAEVLKSTWGELPLVLDPTAGGGSIPFVATRLGIPTYANDLSGVAAVVLTAGVKIPAEIGREICIKLHYWGEILTSRVKNRMLSYFPATISNERVMTYLFVNSVNCPRTGRLVPLMPDKWLCKDGGKEATVRFIFEDESGRQLDEPKFEILVKSKVSKTDANKGTVKRGAGISPYDNLVIDGDYIKSEAQAGRMRQVLYTVVTRNTKGDRVFRSPTKVDLDAITAAEKQLELVRKEWEEKGFIPTEEFPRGNDNRPLEYGMRTWASMFTPRQLLVHGTFSEEFARIVPEIQEAEPEHAESILIELALLQNKALNWNSRLTSWDVSRQKMRSVFDRHDFAFKWTLAEMEGANELYPWTLHVIENYEQIVDLLDGGVVDQLGVEGGVKRRVTVSQGSAASMPSIEDGSVANICMDPPYFDNVMYAELADFFYVWEKHTLDRLLPDFFADEVSDKVNEAVANRARFATAGKRRNELAELDYEAKMTAIFAECRRMLRDDGVMTVMFTHKRAEAWDSLGTGLLEAGFTIETSWPVNTEAEHSLHQANMNSAASTIMLVCRKHPKRRSNSKVFLEDIADEVRMAARDAVARFENDGIDGVDLLLSTYGPTLSVISRHWPVYSSVADELGRDRLLRPEEALDLAREELVALRQRRLVGHAAQFDNLTDFVLIAWDTFKAREFSFDTARLLALAVGGLDIDELVKAKVIEKSAGKVRLLEPHERLRRDSDSVLPGVKIDAKSFGHMIDAIDTAIYLATEDGYAAAKRFLDKAGLLHDQNFIDAYQALVNAVPRTSVNGNWVVPIAGVLDTLATSHLPDIVLPPIDDLTAREVPTEKLFKDD